MLGRDRMSGGVSAGHLAALKTVLENVMLPATLRGIDRTERAKQLLDLVSLSGFSENIPSSFGRNAAARGDCGRWYAIPIFC